MKAKRFFYLLVMLFAAALLLIPTSAAFAHGSTTIGDYTLEIGFKNEPALQGQLNGLELIVMNSKMNKPVTGLEDTLQAEIIFGASKKALKIEPVEGKDGAYTANVLPTTLGDYTWHIFGKIENTPVDVQMTSSPTTFVSVVPPSDVSFPGQQPASSDLAASLAQANQRATIGIIVGAVGLLLSIVSLVVAFTRRPAGQ